MSDNLTDPIFWRLRYGGVPFRLKDVSGDFEPETASAQITGLVHVDDFLSFLAGVLPPPKERGNISVPQSLSLPGMDGIVAKKVSFKSFGQDRPVDPFGFDPNAPDGTYGDVLEVSIDYGTGELQEPKADDPTTFLEISGQTTGEFLNTTAPKGKWRKKRPAARDEDPFVDYPAVFDSAEEAIYYGWEIGDPGPVVDPKKKKAPKGAPTKVTDTPVANPTVPVNIVMPNTEWTMKWSQIPHEYFRNVVIHRVRWLMGRVNSTVFPVLFDAIPGTLLFTGFNVSQSYTWRSGRVGKPPMNLEIKILEKRIEWNGVVRGHNEFWRPGVGWETLLIDGRKPTFEGRNFNVLFAKS